VTKLNQGGASGRDAASRIQRIHLEHAEAARAFFETGTGGVERIAEAFIAALRAGRTLLFFGNGGSAADAQHLAAEFVNRFVVDRPGLPALALTTDTSVLTSIGNDQDFTRIFSRQVEALGRPGDVAVGISTSGRSANVLEGLRAARAKGMVTVGLTGQETPLQELCDHLVSVPSRTTARIQEVHILVGHILCELVDEAFTPSARRSSP
jgi:D-sedoheptulose 7-phosphate isomerase